MKKILVPTDFSEQAEYALKVAAQLARKYDGEIFLLHMLELPMHLVGGAAASGSGVGGGGSQNLPEALYFMKLAKKRFGEIRQEPYLKDIKLTETVEFHQAFDGIMEISEKHNCDLIVMGSHGATGFKEMFIGSNTEKVVRNSTIPVLVIKNDHEIFDIKDFVFATDCDLENKHTLQQAKRFAGKLGARLHLVYINTANNFMTHNDAQQCLDDFVEGEDDKDYTLNIYNDVTVENGILNFARSIDAGLIGISTHGRKGIAHFFNGSISEDLVNHAQQPVVTFKI
ncbi:universal stress protein [Antarcticibacterium flavum]|uniref:Universal stress protein n=1 Tax=Antarcticibacterium flavum TaxID=2058175 RepID=A0A5B7X5W2_9FLAO|nr:MULTISPECIES: universal stress protein [Antarcticibacterium]MCM4158338.1 universal stress protein UspA [Antarcticibacterium sp. W02-3]QCY70102.1 universal stress protein [Antarcticibacterium flavum]